MDHEGCSRTSESPPRASTHQPNIQLCMIHMDDFAGRVPVARCCQFQFPVEWLDFCCRTWSLALTGLLETRALFDSSTKCSVAWGWNMLCPSFLQKLGVGSSHRLLFEGFVMISNIFLQQSILLTAQTRQTIPTLAPFWNETYQAVTIDCFSFTEGFSPATEGSFWHNCPCCAVPTKQFVAFSGDFKLLNTGMLEQFEFFYLSNIIW